MRLFGKFQHGLRAFVLSLVPRWHDADEIFQNTNLILWRKFREFDQARDFHKWACQVAYYEVLEWRRKQHRAKAALSNNVLAQLAKELIDDMESCDLREQALMQCLEKLPAKDRRVMQLRYFAECSVSDVAKKVGRSIDAVYKATNRIRWQLLGCVQRRTQQEDHA